MPKMVKGKILPETALKRARAVELKTAGWSFEQIGRELGCTSVYAHRLFHDALKAIPASSVEQHRETELAKLDRWERQCNEILDGVHPVISNGRVVHWEKWSEEKQRFIPDPDGDLVDHGARLAAMDRLIKIQDARRKLLGLDAPARTDVSVSAVDTGSIELRALLQQRAERNAAERERLAEPEG